MRGLGRSPHGDCRRGLWQDESKTVHVQAEDVTATQERLGVARIGVAGGACGGLL